MLNRLNHIIPDLLLKPGYKFHRHLSVQLVVVLITMNIFWDEPDVILPGRFGVWVAYFLLINSIIYINIYMLVPRLLLKGRTLYYILSLPVLMLAAALIIGALHGAAPDGGPANTPTVAEGIIGAVSTVAAFSFLIAGLTALLLFKNRLGNLIKISELEAATMEIELANLQNQINPHFLFNMLNNANILASEDADKSSYVLSKLNDLLRYQIAGSSRESILLRDDIGFLNDYLELEKIRRDRFAYSIELDGDCDIRIPPLLFISFVENAVKHNPENDSYVKILLCVRDGELHFECENPKARSPHAARAGGIGLANIRKRLELLYGQEYTLELRDEDEKYTVIMRFKI